MGEALTAIDMASVLGPERPEVAEAAARGREILARLGAWPFLERLERLMVGRSTGPSEATATIVAEAAPA